MRLFIFVSLLLATQLAHALSLKPSFQSREMFNLVQNYEDPTAQLHVSVQASEMIYEDLTQKSMKEIEELFATKKEYGKMFGFNDWQPGRHKIIEEARGRFLLLEGSYTSNQGKPVYFIEIYWADKKMSQQFLVTSDVKPLTIEEYTKVFNK